MAILTKKFYIFCRITSGPSPEDVKRRRQEQVSIFVFENFWSTAVLTTTLIGPFRRIKLFNPNPHGWVIKRSTFFKRKISA
jgi:hypothetical protein